MVVAATEVLLVMVGGVGTGYEPPSVMIVVMVVAFRVKVCVIMRRLSRLARDSSNWGAAVGAG